MNVDKQTKMEEVGNLGEGVIVSLVPLGLKPPYVLPVLLSPYMEGMNMFRD